ncbi:hypothetical protein ILUMI_14289 [Ignelater luminosus]|uniref:DDE-1 domain-containing protein n=1 Tax=Ignelater luminosus TaxID=2038154 RepID=A0A8K0GA49_IGNLU|nr:hypothetical protein ILUMI_14289 [Ignelater luminosus]
MRTAIQEVTDGKSIRQVAQDNIIAYTTLQRYIAKAKGDPIHQQRLVPNYTTNQVFSDEQENALKQYYQKCALLFYGLSTKDCRHVAYQMAVHNNVKVPTTWVENEMAGIDWLRGFRQRHPDLSLRKPEACSLARATAFNRETVKTFFENLENVIRRDTEFADGTRIFNLDETGTTTVHKAPKVLAPKGHRNVCKVTSGEKGILCTTCNIIGAGGQAIPPAIIFLRKKTNPRMAVGTPPGSLILASPSGWMNTELFIEVMKHFIKRTGSTKENPSILIMDNRESHLSIGALDLAKEFGMTMLTLHPHTSAKLQPLDVGIHGPFKSYYNSAMDSWMLRNPGVPVTIYDVGQMIGTAFIKAMTPSNIMQYFKKTGIWPFDKDIFSDDDFLPSTDQETNAVQQPAEIFPSTSKDNESYFCSSPGPSNQYQNIDRVDITVNTFDSQLNNPTDINNPTNQHLVEPAVQQILRKSVDVPSIVTPDQFRKLFKAPPRTGERKPRKLGRSLIATDTPEKEEIAKDRSAAKRMKTSNKSVTRKVLQSDSEEEGEVVLDDESDVEGTWLEENSDENFFTAESLSQPVSMLPKEGQYVLVKFESKKQRLFYTAKVLEERNDALELYVSFLRYKKGHFTMPNVPDLSFVKDDQIVYILPKPTVSGSTARQQSYYKFSIDLSNINIR